MTIKLHRFAFLILGLVFFTESSAQSVSPYSRFGLGYLRSNVFSSNKAMGEIAGGFRSSVGLNPANPASYSELSLTTSEIGANVDISSIKTQDSTYLGTYGTLNHFALGFPIKRNVLGMSIGLLPYATTNYKFQQQNLDTFSVYTGKGSLYKVYLGSAYQIAGFSIGFNVGYLFGKQEYYKGFSFTDTLNALNTRSNLKMDVGGFLYDLGIQYKKRIIKRTNDNGNKSDVYFTAGIFGNSQLKVNSTVNGVWERFYTTSSGTDRIIDTPLALNESKGKISLPYTIGGGFTVGSEFWWIIGADFKYSNWSSFSSPISTDRLNDSWCASLGFGYTPDYSGKFIKRIQYKVGGYAAKSEVLVGTSQVNEYGGTFGLVIPFVFGRDRVSSNDYLQIFLMGDIGSRIPQNTALIRETYYRLTFGVSFNSLWFQKRKFD
jgi:hypothetical protein